MNNVSYKLLDLIYKNQVQAECTKILESYNRRIQELPFSRMHMATKLSDECAEEMMKVINKYANKYKESGD